MQVIKKITAYRMKISRRKHPAWRLFALAVIIMIFSCNPAKAQLITATSIQELAFGSFAIGGTGGTIEISPSGNRSVSGTVIGLANSPVSAAVFNVTVKGAGQGQGQGQGNNNQRIVQINFTEPAELMHSGGVHSMTISNFTSEPANNFIATEGNNIYQVNVGATLNVQDINANPAGNYSGFFTVTFIRE